MARLLDNEIIETIRSDVDRTKTEKMAWINQYEGILKKIKSANIIESFHGSGLFGEEEANNIQRLVNLAKEIQEIITEKGGLIDLTTKFLDDQEELNRKGGK